MRSELTAAEIVQIKKQARARLGECRKTNEIIGMQIFSILGLYARVIYYPLGSHAPWGFTRMSGSRNDALLEKPFAALNTSIPADCQAFAAAHELYHIWYGKNPDFLPSDLLDERGKTVQEKKANRFAAEFLVDADMLKREIDIFAVDKFNIKNILQLAEMCLVPYRTMVKRLHEEMLLSDEAADVFLAETEDSVLKYKKRYSIYQQEPDCRIVMDNLVELAVSAYEKRYLTFEKLEYLLRICGLHPEELGIEKEADIQFPSDEELDEIMEE